MRVYATGLNPFERHRGAYYAGPTTMGKKQNKTAYNVVSSGIRCVRCANQQYNIIDLEDLIFRFGYRDEIATLTAIPSSHVRLHSNVHRYPNVFLHGLRRTVKTVFGIRTTDEDIASETVGKRSVVWRTASTAGPPVRARENIYSHVRVSHDRIT